MERALHKKAIRYQLVKFLYLTTHNIHKKQTSMPPVGFEPAIPASERPQTHALDRAATEIGYASNNIFKENVEKKRQ